MTSSSLSWGCQHPVDSPHCRWKITGAASRQQGQTASRTTVTSSSWTMIEIELQTSSPWIPSVLQRLDSVARPFWCSGHEDQRAARVTRQLFADSHDAVVCVWSKTVQQKNCYKNLPCRESWQGKVLQLDTNDSWKYLKCKIHSDTTDGLNHHWAFIWHSAEFLSEVGKLSSRMRRWRSAFIHFTFTSVFFVFVCFLSSLIYSNGGHVNKKKRSKV